MTLPFSRRFREGRNQVFTRTYKFPGLQFSSDPEWRLITRASIGIRAIHLTQVHTIRGSSWWANTSICWAWWSQRNRPNGH
jgi:hypothetical protein